MQVTVHKTLLLKALYLAQGIADRKSTTPALSNVLIRTEGTDALRCEATDLRTSMKAEIEANVVVEGGINVSARHLYEIIKNLADESVSLKRLENNWLEIHAAKASYKLLGISERDYPRLPELNDVSFSEIDASTVSEMFSKTIFAVSTDDTRPHLSGIFLETNGNDALMVSTDGHRLCKVERDLGKVPKISKGVIIPRKGVLELRRLLDSIDGTCDLGIGEGHLFIKGKDVLMSVALVDAQFPPYKQVLSQKNDKHILLNRQYFLEALRRISILSSDKNYGIRFKLLKNTLSLSSDNPDLGEAKEEISIQYQGQSLTIGFNARYVMDVVGEISEAQVILELNGELDPGLLHGEKETDYIGVIMPMRI